MAGELLLRHPPAFAGGRLLWWNRVLRARAAHAAGGPEPVLLLDPALTRAADQRADVLNSHGDVVRLPAPEGGAFRDARARAAFVDALEDQMPATAEQRAVVARLLPEAGVAPLEHALRLWPELFPGLRVRAVGAGDGDGTVTDTPSGITWVGAVHRRAMQELGVDVAIAARGEAELVAAVGIPLEGDLGEEVARLRESLDAGCARLRPLAESVDPHLLGAWRRMRRDLRGALQQFARAGDRSGRNRAGLRGARIHQLAQGLRPLDLEQEQGLSLLAAAALFQLEIDNADRYATSLATGEGGESLLLDT